MSTVVEIPAGAREAVAPLFAANRFDTVLIRSVLEGGFGCSWADDAVSPTVARLAAGSFTMLAGDPRSPAVPALLRRAPVWYVTPENAAWRQAIDREFGDALAPIRFVEFSPDPLSAERLHDLARTVPAGLALAPIDRRLAERLPSDMPGEHFMECFASIDDYLARGVGWCVVRDDRIVSAASSMAACREAIDIEIVTAEAHRRRGLGTAVGAALVLDCLRRGLVPHWLAANAVSERLALKLGYERAGSYETLARAAPPGG